MSFSPPPPERLLAVCSFFPELLQKRGWVTAIFGKWHMGMFKKEYLPTSRGFNFSTGMLSGASDHYSHVVEGAYDWHAMDQPNFGAAGRYAGNLVRDDALAFIEKVSGAGGSSAQPFFLYLPFQECHSPFQVDANYTDFYPHLVKLTHNLPSRVIDCSGCTMHLQLLLKVAHN